MPDPEPRLVAWTDHALAKAQLLGHAANRCGGGLTGHSRRTGAADWVVTAGPLTIAYNHPADDELTVLVVTLWRQG